MNLEKFNEMLLESVGVGLALLRPETLEVVFHNRRFGELFPAVVERPCTFDELIPDLAVERLRERIGAGRPFTCDAEGRLKRRTISLALQITQPAADDLSLLIVECQNVSKIRELEYMIELYSKMVEKQNRSLQREKERAEKLLLNIMPKTVYEELKTFGVTTPQRYDAASVLMLDFVGFTEMAISQDPSALIAELNDIFTSFDRIAEQFGCERIKTIGDAYMAVSGIPEPTPDHAQNIAKTALLFVRYLARRNASHAQTWQCRVGIASGPVIGSIVGIHKYVYDIFGPGVNLAARMETFSEPMQITLCADMQRLLREEFRCTERGTFEVKGFGQRRLYSLDGAHDLRPRDDF